MLTKKNLKIFSTLAFITLNSSLNAAEPTITFIDPQSGQVLVSHSTTIPDLNSSPHESNSPHTLYHFQAQDRTQFNVAEIGGRFYFIFPNGSQRVIDIQGKNLEGVDLLHHIFTLGRSMLG